MKEECIIRRTEDKIPYFTRMMIGGIGLLIVGALAHDLGNLNSVSPALTIPGGFLTLLGTVGRLLCLIDAGPKS